jgi:hypothetical protein
LRASATIIVLRVPTRLSAVRARYHNACFIQEQNPMTLDVRLALPDFDTARK